MDILSLLPRTYSNLTLLIMMMARISFLFSTFVLFRREYINSRIIISLSFLLAFFSILITHAPAPNFEIFSLNMMSSVIYQALIGFVIGIILNILFEIFTAVGQLISTQIGLSMASLIDPKLGAITSLTYFYNYMAILIFFKLNGHLTAIRLILDSFVSIPVENSFPLSRLKEVVLFTNNIFVSSVSLSMTIIISILLTNLTIAVMTRFAPQFNVFSIGINITMIAGLIFIYLMFNLFISNGEHIFDSGFIFIRHIISGVNANG